MYEGIVTNLVRSSELRAFLCGIFNAHRKLPATCSVNDYDAQRHHIQSLIKKYKRKFATKIKKNCECSSYYRLFLFSHYVQGKKEFIRVLKFLIAQLLNHFALKYELKFHLVSNERDN